MDNKFKEIFWCGFLMWAIGEDDILAEFEKETGNKKIRLPKTSIEKMIDKATGYDKEHYRRSPHEPHHP
jgi:hypothetical protein